MSTILTGIGAAIASVIPFVGLKRQSGDAAHIQQGNVPDPFLELPHEPVTDEDLENEWSRWKEMRETRSVKQAEVSCLNETKPVSVSVPKSQPVSKGTSKSLKNSIKKKKCVNWIKRVLNETDMRPDVKVIMQQFSVSKATAYRYLRQAETEIVSVSQCGMEVVSCETAKEAA